MNRIFKRKDGFNEKNLLHSGLDHLSAAEKLFQISSSFFDSAGYLCHLGVELYFKAFILNKNNEFDEDHSLRKLYNQTGISLSKKGNSFLSILEDFYTLRYPPKKNNKTQCHKVIEISDAVWKKVEQLLIEIVEQMPEDMLKEYNSINDFEKNKRVLMSKLKPEIGKKIVNIKEPTKFINLTPLGVKFIEACIK
jgi:HEPN domain-containing protein